jgi:hypothetical protein
MKRCPTCQKTYTDRNLSYCIEDGTPLVPISDDDDTTVVSRKQSTQPDQDDWNAVAYRAPSAYIPPTTAKRRVWPWVLGLLSLLVLIVVGLVIAAIIFAPSMIRRAADHNQNASAPSNRNSTGPPAATPNTNSQANVNSNSNDSANANTNTTAPTDKDQVLAQLTDLEHEWTVANINADKKKLDVILADDYVGPAVNGQLQGKRDYINTIQRDRTIEKWEFKDLKVTLRGDRATLTGKIYLDRTDGNEVYEFVDKFVWRDGRWQATGSVVTRA